MKKLLVLLLVFVANFTTNFTANAQTQNLYVSSLSSDNINIATNISLYCIEETKTYAETNYWDACMSNYNEGLLLLIDNKYVNGDYVDKYYSLLPSTTVKTLGVQWVHEYVKNIYGPTNKARFARYEYPHIKMEITEIKELRIITTITTNILKTAEITETRCKTCGRDY